MASPNIDPGAERLPDYHELTSSRQVKDTIRLRTLRGKLYLVSLVLGYFAFAITPWVFLCLVGRGPIYVGSKHSDYNVVRLMRDASRVSDTVRAASIVAAIASALTIPTIASVCTYAAVAFTQYHEKGQKLSLRQTLTLANQEWMSPLMPAILLAPTLRRQHGSGFLWFACFLTMLGLVIWPVQQGFLEPVTITTVGSEYSWNWESNRYAVDMPDLFSSPGYDDSFDVVSLRQAMETSSPQKCNPRLWWNGTADDHGNWQQKCTGNSGFSSWFEDRNYDRVIQEHFWDPSQVFVAEIPFGYNTGFKRAYIPRFNTSIDYENITTSDAAPDGCFTDEDDSNFIKYGYDYVDEEDFHLDWHIRTCMSSSALKTPLMDGTRDRQDFEEVFYLNISTAIDWGEYHTSNIFRVRARTTTGYFELPNNYNNGTHGPLLDKFPSISENDTTIGPTYHDPPSSSDRDRYGESDGFPTVLEYVKNKGPLALTYVSLFGNASFISQWSNRAYTTAMARAADGFSYVSTCAAYAPLGHLLSNDGHAASVCGGSCFAGRYSSSYNVLDCVKPRAHFNTTSGGSDGWRPHPVGVWLSAFVIDTSGSDGSRHGGAGSAMRAALRMAAFFANEIRLTSPATEIARVLTVQSDPGVAGVVGAPVVPFKGLVVGSVLLGAFVFLLLALAVFAAVGVSPRWTERLDATAAMRMGAALAASNEGGLVSLKNNGWHLRGSKTRGVDVAPGFVGDAVPEGDVGRLAVGAEAPLRWGRRYEPDVCGGTRMG